MANLNLTVIPVDGGLADLAAAAVAAAAGGDTAPVGPGRFLFVKNGGASPVTVTLATPGRVSGLDIENPATVVAAGKEALLPLSRLFSGTNGRAAITYDAVTSVTVGALELGT
ncbi:hypothetical protein ABZ714_19490 [Streptomyces sp. NPDC006798]|uniref:hypothetical protein n=1 Tax=Streptomyces sp. NPDC006798 TaxID=3155462 RepID=UPI0033F6B522